jgi:hypothetical protein
MASAARTTIAAKARYRCMGKGTLSGMIEMVRRVVIPRFLRLTCDYDLP